MMGILLITVIIYQLLAIINNNGQILNNTGQVISKVIVMSTLRKQAVRLLFLLQNFNRRSRLHIFFIITSISSF